MVINSIILATGSYTSGKIISTEDLVRDTIFYDKKGNIEKIDLEKIKTTIGVEYRMWANDDEQVEDLGAIALNNCFESSKVKKDEIDYLIVAHNTGELIPNISSRIVYKLSLNKVIPEDKIFGCQGWCYGLDHADLLIKSKRAKKVAVIGAEILSRIRGKSSDSLLFSDGAGAVILGDYEDNENIGILASHLGADITLNDVLKLSKRFRPEEIVYGLDDKYLKDLDMYGKGVFKKAIIVIPETFNKLLEKANLKEENVKYLLKHQASEKILEVSSKIELTKKGEIKNLDELIKQYRRDKVPNSVKWLGNSSVATIPTLLDILLKKKVDNHDLDGLLQDLCHYNIKENDILAFLSVGAGVGWAGNLVKMHPSYWDYLKD